MGVTTVAVAAMVRDGVMVGVNVQSPVCSWPPVPRDLDHRALPTTMKPLSKQIPASTHNSDDSLEPRFCGVPGCERGVCPAVEADSFQALTSPGEAGPITSPVAVSTRTNLPVLYSCNV